jgi:uncharacterized membrane protein
MGELKQIRIGEAIRRYFLTGTIVLVPVTVTLWLIFITARLVGHTLHLEILSPELLDIFTLPGWLKSLLAAVFHVGNFLTGFTITLALIMLVGVMVRTFIGKWLISFWENLIDRIPFVRGVYSAVKQLTEAIFLTGERSFTRVVLVEYPRKGMWVVGFVTGETCGEISQKLNQAKMVNVFVPSTPNPTTGYFLVMPEVDLIALDLSTEDAFRLIISGGLSNPESAICTNDSTPHLPNQADS